MAGFDLIRINNFPFNNTLPAELWLNSDQELVMPETSKLFEEISGCGKVKGIAASFVGSFCSCLVLSEVLRAYHRGVKSEHIYLSLRDLSNRKVIVKEDYGLNELETGFANVLAV